jgi:putative DNA-invertase from lambdoid prophage Rac
LNLTLQDLQSWDVSLVAQTGLQFELRSVQGKLIASLMAVLAEFERDLLRERVLTGSPRHENVGSCSAGGS